MGEMLLMSLGAQVAHVDKVPLDHDMKESETRWNT